MQRSFAVKLQKHFVDWKTSPNSHRWWGDNEWIFIFGWTAPFKSPLNFGMKTAFVLQWANLQCVSDASLQLRICCCSGASSYFPFVAERQYSSSKTVGLFDVEACVCVFIHLVCPEFCLWSNIYFLFPALLANDNLIHPGESCGGSWGEEQRMRGQKGSRKRWAVKQCCVWDVGKTRVNIFRWNDQISPNSRSFTSLTGHVSA